jgi:small subunit ribosomal protein S6
MEKSVYRKYKTFIFFQPKLEKNAILEILTKYYKTLSSKETKFCFQNLGTKLFSYPIKGFSSGTYIQMTYVGNGELVREVNKQLSITESVIRHITIKKEDN